MKAFPAIGLAALIVLLSLPGLLWAADVGIPAFSVTKDANGNETYTLTLQVLMIMTMLTLLPAGLLMLTAFTRIIIVLSILRQAIGLMQAPSGQILIGLALFMTIFVMTPVFERVYNDALKPYMEEEIEMMQALDLAREPIQEFMTHQTRETDLAMFVKVSGKPDIESPEDIPFSLLVPAFITSELKTAFQIGFLIYIPFLVIDLVVASVLMAMGMMMLSPMMISLPFKIMLFVLVDGWSLIMGTLAASFYV